MRPKVKSPVKHVSLAFSSQDISRFPDNEEGDALMVEIAKKWMEQMGIRNTQYIDVYKRQERGDTSSISQANTIQQGVSDS